jgi:hypothetical protein
VWAGNGPGQLPGRRGEQQEAHFGRDGVSAQRQPEAGDRQGAVDDPHVEPRQAEVGLRRHDTVQPMQHRQQHDPAGREAQAIASKHWSDAGAPDRMREPGRGDEGQPGEWDRLAGRAHRVDRLQHGADQQAGTDHGRAGAFVTQSDQHTTDRSPCGDRGGLAPDSEYGAVHALRASARAGAVPNQILAADATTRRPGRTLRAC